MPRPINIEALLVWAFREQKVETTRSPPEDALTVYWAVMALPEPYGSMARQVARDGVTPDWRPPHGTIVSLSKVRRLRNSYADWVRTLIVLQRTLDGALRNFRAFGPTIPDEPWKIAAETSDTPRRALTVRRWTP